MEKENSITQRSINFKEQINQFIKGYNTEPAKGLLHGFQKDIIQNSWGHRINLKNKDKKWKLTIEYKETEIGNFIIVEDHNSTGLIGNNFSQSTITEMMEKNIALDRDEKLARFQSLYNSGHNANGAGLFGRGKMMYQAVSKSNKYYFDTLTKSNSYYSNRVELQKIFEIAHEGDEAKNLIYRETGLTEKTSYGTRVIIADPFEEIIEGIRNGEIIDYINETWWRIFYKYDACVEILFNGDVIGYGEVPKLYQKYLNDKTRFEEFKNITVADGYHVKHLGIFYVDEDEVDNDLCNISYYRSDMKIGEVFNVNSLPIDDKFKRRICGYIEFDRLWEDDLSLNENLEHYGPENRRKSSFQYMKNVIEKKLDLYAINKGIKKLSKNKDENEALKSLVNDLTDFLHDFDIKFDYDTSIKPNPISPVKIEISKLYPNQGSRKIYSDQKMKVKLKVLNKSIYDTFVLKINISDKINNNILLHEKVSCSSMLEREIVIDYDELFQNSKNSVSISLITLDSVIKESVTFPIFADIDEEVDINDISMKIVNYDLPNKSKSIYLNEEIQNIVLEIRNNTEEKGRFSFSVLVQDVKDRNHTIEVSYRLDSFYLDTNSVININIDKIPFGEKYIRRKGPLKVKFRLSHLEGISTFEKGDIVIEPGFIVFFETEEENIGGNLFKIVSKPLGEKYIKSFLEIDKDGGYVLVFNTDYPVWKNIQDDTTSTTYKLYCVTEMIGAVINIQFKNQNFTITGKNEKEISDLSPSELMIEMKRISDYYLGQFLENRGWYEKNSI